jgi:hypothetical protein
MRFSKILEGMNPIPWSIPIGGWVTYQKLQIAFSTSRGLPSGDQGAVLASLLAAVGIPAASVTDFRDASKKVEGAIRFRCAEERGLIGKTHLLHGGKVVEVHPIRNDGYVRIKGVRGTFHPIGFAPVPEK